MVIISGGETSPRSVEAGRLTEAGWLPLTSCDLPALPQPRWAHTQDGPLVCGGYGFGEVGLDVMTSCVSLGGQGGWVRSHDLLSHRHEHSSWRTEAGTLLLGGEGEASHVSSELVSDEVTPGFKLKEQRRCDVIPIFIFKYIFNYKQLLVLHS